MYNNINHKKRILFVGVPDMAYVTLDGLNMANVNIVGCIGPREDHETYYPFRNFIKERGLNFIEWTDLEKPDFIKKIKDLNIDLGVVTSFNYKIPKELLNATKDGFINLHPSLLPDYRGANPYTHIIANGEKVTGVTIHIMEESFDTGDIVMQKTLPITNGETMGTLFNRTNLLGLDMLIEVLRNYEKNPLPREKQENRKFKKAKNITERDLYLDYENKSAKELERFIRALNPFLIATTNFRQTFVKIFSAEYTNYNVDMEPGTIAKVDDENIYITTKNGLLIPQVLQFGSFFVGTSKDFIRILDPKIGETFK